MDVRFISGGVSHEEVDDHHYPFRRGDCSDADARVLDQGGQGRAEEINATPQIAKLEPRAYEWGKHYPRQYGSYMQTKESDEIRDMLEENPALVVMWAGYGFSKDYNAPRGHFYILEDNINTLRTGAPVDMKTGPMPTACWTCKSPDVPRLIDKMGENDFYTGKWARFGSEIVNPVGCADCHDNETMELTVTRDYLKRALDAEGSRPLPRPATRTCAPWSAPSATPSTISRPPSGPTRTARSRPPRS